MLVFVLANYGIEIMHAHSISVCVCSAGWDYIRAPYKGRPEKRQDYSEIIVDITMPGKPRIQKLLLFRNNLTGFLKEL